MRRVVGSVTLGAGLEFCGGGGGIKGGGSLSGGGELLFCDGSWRTVPDLVVDALRRLTGLHLVDRTFVSISLSTL